MGCRKCLPHSVVQLKGKHCQKPHCRNEVVDTFGHTQVNFHESDLNFHEQSKEMM